MADSTQVNVRYSNVLLARIDTVAGEGKRSEWILEACRIRLDEELAIPAEWASITERNKGKPLAEHESYPASANTGSIAGIVREHPIGKPDLEALVSGIMERREDSDIQDASAQLSEGKMPWPSERCSECDSCMREVKGKWACVDQSCAMYGREQKR